MKRFLKFPVMLVLMVSMSLGLYSNGINLNGNGSKAIAMGGAFVGLADDYSAVFWNPAGLTQMTQTNLVFFGTDIIPKATYEFAYLGIDAKSESKHYPSPGIGFFKPMGSNVVAGIYGFAPSGIGGKWKGSELAALSGGLAFNWESFLGIFSLSPAVGIKVSPKFSLGMALNLYYGMLKLKKPTDLGQYEENLKGIAVGATFGMLFKPTSKFSIGLTLRTPYKAKLKGDADMPGAALLGFPPTDDAERSITAPLWAGIGICLKPTPKLTLTADAQYTNWEKLKTIPVDFTSWNAFESGSILYLQWKDAVQIRFGMEYQVSTCFALRAGFYLDPRVGVDETANILLPELAYKWICFGFGIKKGKIILDVAVEYGIGKEIDVPFIVPPIDLRMPGIHGVNILVPNIALTILL
jgi:long-chain fatty acid transport protein